MQGICDCNCGPVCRRVLSRGFHILQERLAEGVRLRGQQDSVRVWRDASQPVPALPPRARGRQQARALQHAVPPFLPEAALGRPQSYCAAPGVSSEFLAENYSSSLACRRRPALSCWLLHQSFRQPRWSAALTSQRRMTSAPDYAAALLFTMVSSRSYAALAAGKSLPHYAFRKVRQALVTTCSLASFSCLTEPAPCWLLVQPISSTCYITAFFRGYCWLCHPNALRAMAKDRKDTTSWPPAVGQELTPRHD